MSGLHVGQTHSKSATRIAGWASCWRTKNTHHRTFFHMRFHLFTLALTVEKISILLWVLYFFQEYENYVTQGEEEGKGGAHCIIFLTVCSVCKYMSLLMYMCIHVCVWISVCNKYILFIYTAFCLINIHHTISIFHTYRRIGADNRLPRIGV